LLSQWGPGRTCATGLTIKPLLCMWCALSSQWPDIRAGEATVLSEQLNQSNSRRERFGCWRQTLMSSRKLISLGPSRRQTNFNMVRRGGLTDRHINYWPFCALSSGRWESFHSHRHTTTTTRLGQVSVNDHVLYYALHRRNIMLLIHSFSFKYYLNTKYLWLLPSRIYSH